jgi:hypothetical protein
MGDTAGVMNQRTQILLAFLAFFLFLAGFAVLVGLASLHGLWLG